MDEPDKDDSITKKSVEIFCYTLFSGLISAIFGLVMFLLIGYISWVNNNLVMASLDVIFSIYSSVLVFYEFKKEFNKIIIEKQNKSKST
ncbi:hypothetical protein [Methanosarcina sp. UBA5]|uniref:hypothetical protein n=1 Tax=Methanosarcina sp. UBA5 TaxID=1915593 RepID=UPI0025EFFC4E|nr:hypothetical protein [Methanosarcina sp. UBA5]